MLNSVALEALLVFEMKKPKEESSSEEELAEKLESRTHGAEDSEEEA